MDSGSGNKAHRDTDYAGSSASNNSLKFERKYNSKSAISASAMTTPVAFNPIGALGIYWSHTYSRAIVRTSNSTATILQAYRPDGRLIFFTSVSGNTWVADNDINDRITEIKDANGNLTGYQYEVGKNHEIESYDLTGSLLEIMSPNGYVQTMAYSCTTVSTACPVTTPTSIAPLEGLLIKVTDSYAKSLNFTYNNEGRMATMTDPAGNVYSYAYDTSRRLISVTYPDDTPADLTNNPKRTYLYAESTYLPYPASVLYPNSLTGIIDENGVRYATYKYDTSGKAMSTEHIGNVDKYSMAFNTTDPNNPVTTVTDPLGSVRTTRFTRILDVLRPTGTDQPGGSGCSAASSATTYDANGNVSSRTDFIGHKVCYAYDLTRNLETARVEGLASVADCASNLNAASLPAGVRKISTQWHPTFRLPMKVAEPKLLTSYSRDAQGNVLTKSEQATTDTSGVAGLNPTVTGTARTWTYTYNSFGQVLTANGPRTDVNDIITTTYYPANDPIVGNRGNVKDITNPLGHKIVYNSYDGNGRLLQMTAANGVITTMTYTPRGWLKSQTVKDSANALVETTTYSYDPTGLLLSVTAPDGSVLSYGYDAAHRLTSVTDSLGNKTSYTLDAMGNRVKEQHTDPNNVLRRNIDRVYDALNRLQTVTGGVQ
jgi:YD repeat-containing protein